MLMQHVTDVPIVDDLFEALHELINDMYFYFVVYNSKSLNAKKNEHNQIELIDLIGHTKILNLVDFFCVA